VSGCSTHGGLLGGFVLGSLEPAEMDEMRRHVAGCPDCGPEARELASLPGLLDRIEPSDVPPPTLSPGVEEAVLDRFAREHRRTRKPRRRRLTVPRLAALGGAVAAAVVLAVVLIGGEEAASPAYATASLQPVAASSTAEGKAYVSEVPAGTRVRLRAGGLRNGRMYELWCVREDGSWVSGGTFRAGGGGRAEAVLTAAVRPGDYHVVVVTRHAEEPGHGRALMRGPLEY
jgi:anti-sigma-K factor RskA